MRNYLKHSVMPKEKDCRNKISAEDQRKLARLEYECDEILDQLFCTPGDENLSRKLREIEIDIIRITGEKTIDY